MEFLALPVHIEETVYDYPTAWRRAGAVGKAQHIIDLCRRNAIAPQNLLEVGAGDGAVLRALAEHDFCSSMHALEISRSGVDVIQGQSIKGLHECRQFNGYTLDFPDKYFDLVYLTHVLEHVEYERALLREILRVGKHHIIEVPLDMHSIAEDGYGSSLLTSYGHINVYSPGLLKFLLRSEGFYLMDELLGRQPFEVIEHLHFAIDGNEKTDAALADLRLRHEADAQAFRAMPRKEQEEKALFCAVLTRAMTEEDARNMHMKHIMQLMRSGLKHEAQLILNAFYKGKKKNVVAALLAKRCVQEKRTEDAQLFMNVAASD